MNNLCTWHVHTEGSVRDSAASVKKMVERAISLGVKALTITDHGTLIAVENELRDIASDCPINLVPGVEAYVSEDGTHRSHLLLVAKNYQGYRAISDAVTLSNGNLHDGFPCMTKEMLTQCFAPGTTGHDNVFATSACMNGVIARIILANDTIESEIAKLRTRQNKYRSPASPQYASLKSRVESTASEEALTNQTLKAAKELAKKPFAARERSVARQAGTADYPVLLAELDRDKKASAEAADSIPRLDKAHRDAKSKLQELKAQLKTEEADHEKWNAIQTRIDDLTSKMESADNLMSKACAEMQWYDGVFGHNNWFAEVQYHGLDAEKQCMPIIANLADQLGIPLVAANDAHTPTNSDDDLRARQIVRSLRFDRFNPIDAADREMYLKNNDELACALAKILTPEQVQCAINNTQALMICHIEWPSHAEHYPKFSVNEDSNALLRQMCYKNIEWRFPNKRGWTKEYADRLEYELNTIIQMGFADYHLIVADFLRYGRVLGKIDFENPPKEYIENPYDIEALEKATQNKIGVGVGPGRGSAVGSLVCYLLGITSLDPIKHKLLFERFLNPERVTMPDIDSDFRPDIRGKVLDYVKHKYGEKAVCCIMTSGTQQARAAIRNTARVFALQYEDDADKWNALGDTIARAVPDELNIKLADCGLEEKFADNANAMRIIHDAYLIEGVLNSIGMHAAGVIIADNGNVADYIPLMYIPGKGEYASQADKDHVEGQGLLKMDFLGLTNLSIINDTVQLVRSRYGFALDPEKFMQESAVFKDIFSTGKTNTVFQFESTGMKEMLRRFRPTDINDVILLVAAYRPGPMQYLDRIIRTKHGEIQPDYVIPDMARVLGSTYGCVVYQEQVMQIFHEFADFSLGEADIIRRYMSKKKTEKFMAYKDKFINGLCAHGADRSKAETFWDELVEFSRYAFNRSHAAAYAYVAYYTAWLKYHYPVEYHCAALNNIPSDRYNKMISDCKANGIKVSVPDINKSQATFSLDGDTIVVGLGNIKGVATSAMPIINERTANGPYKSLLDFVTRCAPDKTTAENFISAGAFDAMHKSRSGMLQAVTAYLDYNKAIRKKMADIESIKAENKPNDKRLTNAQTRLDTLRTEMNAVEISETADDTLARLLKEKELIGAFVSGHPVTSYGSPTRYGCVQISDAETNSTQSFIGLISNLRIMMRKSDHKEMAFFTLEDPSSSIEVCVYTDSYAKNVNFIQESTVVKVTGKIVEEEDSVKLVASNITQVHKPRLPISIYPANWNWWKTIGEPQVLRYLTEDGAPLKVYLNGRYTDTKYTVSPEIRKDPVLFPKK